MVTDDYVTPNHFAGDAARYLARLAATGGGYMLRGVSGWAHSRDVEAGTRMRMDGELPRLQAMRMADRVNVSLARFEKPTWVYRITDTGARVSAETWGDAYERVRVPGELEKPMPLYIAPGPLNALEVLRLAYNAESGPERFGERGWRTGRELTLFVDVVNTKEDTGRRFHRIDSMELKWLADGGLVERRDQHFPWGRERPVVCWRVSEFGRTVRLLMWRSPQSDDTNGQRR